MSQWGDVFTAFEAEVRIAIPTLPDGENGFERADGLGEDLTAGKLPHVYVRSIVEATDLEPGGFGSEAVSTLFTFSLWTINNTQEEVALLLDAIRDQVRSNPTLGLAGCKSFISARGIIERPDRNKRESQFVLQVDSDF